MGPIPDVLRGSLVLGVFLAFSCGREAPTDTDLPDVCETASLGALDLQSCTGNATYVPVEGTLFATWPDYGGAYCHVDAVDLVEECSIRSGADCSTLLRAAETSDRRTPIRRVPVKCQPRRVVEMMAIGVDWPENDNMRAFQSMWAVYDGERLVQVRVIDLGESRVNARCCLDGDGGTRTHQLLFGEPFDADFEDPAAVEYTAQDVRRGTVPP